MQAYIDAYSQILIDEFPGDKLQAIAILQSQCADMTFADQIRYNRMFQKVVHKGGGSAINYIKIFHNAKSLSISVVNSYTEDHLMNTFLDSF